MPNDGQMSLEACISALEEVQNGPEDEVFSTTYKNHLNLLQSLNTVLSNKVEVSPSDADRVLKICLRYTTDVRCILCVFSIISELIDIDKVIKKSLYFYCENLLQSSNFLEINNLFLF